MSDVFFYLLAALTLGSASIVALSPNIVHATLALLGTFLGAAGLYIQLAADFLAAVQVLVYVGGTLTLLLFAVMLTSRMREVQSSNSSTGRLPAFILVGAFLAVLGQLLARHPWQASPVTSGPSTAPLGHAFLSTYLLPFELGSLILLAALVGSVVLARRAVRRTGEDR